MSSNFHRVFTASLVLALGACAGSDTMPTSVRSGLAVDLVGDMNNNFTLTPGVVNVCAFFGDDLGPAATLNASAPSGEDVYQGNFTITPLPHCLEAWNASSEAAVDVSAALVSATAGWELERIVVAVGTGVGDLAFDNLYGTSSATVNVGSTTGGFIWFKFKEVDIPVGGGQGCTPGYWRQTQHFDSWTAPYTPTTLFSDVFANAFPGKTLLDVVSLGGSGLNALGRMSVAALLNAASADVSYDYSTAQIIAAFNTAFATGNKKQYEQQKDVFDFLNNQGCPLN
jgi:hypothetical protein